MLVEVKDLEIGDEIMISVNSHFRYLKVLKQPRISKKVHWRTKVPLYTAVKCSTRIEDVNYTYNTHTGATINRTYKEYKFTDEDHNTIMNINLNNRGIFLIKKSK
jgi:predicted transcriptional regulator